MGGMVTPLLRDHVAIARMRIMIFVPSRKFRTCRRIDEEGHAHYLTFGCWRKLNLLTERRACLEFLDGISVARVKCPFDLWAFVLMPQHVHMLVFPHAQESISCILKAIKEPFSKRVLARLRREKSQLLPELVDRQPSGRSTCRFWQPGGGHDRNIWTAQELHEKIRYIHNNPVRRGLVDRAEDWPWSSCRAWEMGIDEPIAIDRDTVPPLES